MFLVCEVESNRGTEQARSTENTNVCGLGHLAKK